MVRADTFPNTVRWSTSGDRKTGSTTVVLFFFKISVNGDVFSKQCLILLELLSSERLLLVVFHGWRVIVRFVW